MPARRKEPFGRPTNVVIIGGGIAGLTVADELTRRGMLGTLRSRRASRPATNRLTDVRDQRDAARA